MIDVIVKYTISGESDLIHYREIIIKGHAWKSTDLYNPNFDKLGMKICSSITTICVALYPELLDSGDCIVEKGLFHYKANTTRFTRNDYRLDVLLYTLNHLYHNYKEYFNKYDFIEIEKEKK